MFTLYHSKPVWFPSSVEDKEDILKNVGNQNVMDLTHWHDNKTPLKHFSKYRLYFYVPQRKEVKEFRNDRMMFHLGELSL